MKNKFIAGTAGHIGGTRADRLPDLGCQARPFVTMGSPRQSAKIPNGHGGL